MDLININQCRKDLLYVTQDVDNWRNKAFLTSALICALKNTFHHNEDVIIEALKAENFMGV